VGKQIKSINVTKNKQILEQKAQKEREEMKRMLLMGMDAAGGRGDDLRILMASQKGACASCLLRMRLFFEKLTPFTSEIRIIGVTITFALPSCRANTTSQSKVTSVSSGSFSTSRSSPPLCTLPF
jgi:hypothetical protein